jgi:uncharacterized membrane protein YphA (DoxX/SURF4 family)
MELLFLLGRIIFGGYFVMMGMNHFMKNAMMAQYAASKGVPSAKMAVYVTGLLLIFGGAGILLGVYTQLAVLLLAVFLIPVSFKMHNFWAIKDPMANMADMVNFMKNTALLGAALMTLAIPEPWAFSVF